MEELRFWEIEQSQDFTIWKHLSFTLLYRFIEIGPFGSIRRF